MIYPLSEALSIKKHEFFITTFLNAIEGSNISKDNIEKILSKFEMKLLADFNNYLKDTDIKNYLPYEINADEFLNSSNKESIVRRLSDYILKFII